MKAEGVEDVRVIVVDPERELRRDDLAALAKCKGGCTRDHVADDSLIPIACPACEGPVQAFWAARDLTLVLCCAVGCGVQFGHVMPPTGSVPS